VALARNIARFYVAMNPDLFRIPDEEGFVDFLESNRAGRVGLTRVWLSLRIQVTRAATR
jgi:hypothetical protein